MKNTTLLASLGLITALSAGPALAGDHLVRFEGGIGVIPVSSVAGTAIVNPTTGALTFPEVTRNDVRGVQAAGQIWVIARLSADVKTSGRIRVKGEGLLLGGGNNVGGNGNASVFATLLCGDVQHSSALTGVPLDPNGDFRIDDVLTPTPPDPCDSPVLLIRNVAGRWFAAGIPKD